MKSSSLISLRPGIDWLDLLNQVLLIAFRAKGPLVAKNVSLKQEGNISQRFFHSSVQRPQVTDRGDGTSQSTRTFLPQTRFIHPRRASDAYFSRGVAANVCAAWGKTT